MTEEELLRYLMRTGPIPVMDLALRSDDLPKMLDSLDSLKKRGDIDIQGTGWANLLADLKARGINSLQTGNLNGASSATVFLSQKAFRKLAS